MELTKNKQRLFIREMKKRMFEHDELNFYKDTIKLLKPKTIEDYIKIVNLGRGTNLWDQNLEFFWDFYITRIEDLLSTREEICNYLIKHNIERNLAYEISQFVGKGKANREFNKLIKREVDYTLWRKYVIELKEKCDWWFIDFVRYLKYIPNKDHGKEMFESIIEEN